MKTPRTPRSAIIVVTQPTVGAHDPQAELVPDEAAAIARAVSPQLDTFAAMYDERKYWPDLYADLKTAFRDPKGVSSDALRQALLWKWGHLNKSNYPDTHKAIIAELQATWSTLSSRLGEVPKDDFARIHVHLGNRKSRFITVAFLTHLVHSDEVPIIDQHNFRAMNALMKSVRPLWKTKKQPSRYEDIQMLTTFMERVLSAWPATGTAPPTPEKFDRFMMMYGKAIKPLV